ncbi:MAG: type III secretion fhipep protein [Gemmatimonadaceae bacterium]
MIPERPADVCRGLLETIEAAEGRRKRRVRDTTADSIGLEIKRRLLEEAVRADPDASAFEGWLLERCLAEGPADGPLRAIALTIWEEWQLTCASSDFRRWLADGAPSADRESPSTNGATP